MFLEFYKLRENPFGVTPDPRFLYFGETHKRALASLLYAVENKRGFSALIAEPGMGKTSLLFRMLDALQDKARTAFLFQTVADTKELLHTMLFDLGIKCASEDPAAMRDALNANLLHELRAGRDVVVVIDEAQNLDAKILETIRQLSNFETAREKLMHIVIAGQPGLAARLADASMTQLLQRISTITRLEPFDSREVVRYVNHRLQTAGYQGPSPIFSADAITLVARASHGIPRNVNNLCFRALTIGFERQAPMIDSRIVEEVISDLQLAARPARRATAPSDPKPGFARAPVRPQPEPAPEAERLPPSEAAPLMLGTYSRLGAWEEEGSSPAHSSRKKWLVVLACFAAIPAVVLALSDSRLGLSGTWPGQVSDRVVNAVLDSTGYSRDTGPALPKLAAPTPPVAAKAQDSPKPSDSGVASGGAVAQTPSGSEVSGNSEDPKHGATQPSGRDQIQRESAGPDAATKSGILSAANQAHPEPGLRTGPGRTPGEGAHAQPATVEVLRPETVFQLAVELYGHSNWIIVEALCAANPQIQDPYAVLKTGQVVHLPSDLVTVTQNYNSKGISRRTH